ncbi:MAG: hypothetical protein G01um101419_370 [Parcubacteria group bacterium Gr01-1014_19]|nr:MAG: hypothetical protein G01um101419_370 [Parcubacteria group bacterium Gr01-1014_19]
MSSFSLSGRQLLSVLLSVVISVMAISFMADAVSYIDADSIGVATATPGVALGVKGAAHVDGFLVVDYIRATSTTASSFGSTSPGGYVLAVGGFGSVKGNWNVEGTSTISSVVATSTLSVGSSSPDMAFSVIGDSLINGALALGGLLDVQGTATSTIDGGLQVDYDTLVVDSAANSVAIGTTTTSGAEDITGPAPKLIVGTGSASTTVAITGGAEVGGALLLKSSDGDGCILISPSQLEADADGTIALVGKVVSCPE